MGDVLACLDGLHAAPNHHRAAGVGQGVAPPQWSPLDLQADRLASYVAIRRRDQVLAPALELASRANRSALRRSRFC